MSTLQQLETYYSHVTRIRPGLIASPDLDTLTQLAGQVDAGTTSFSAAALKVEGLAAGSVSVAELTYQFFTGATPYIGGLDFLAQPDGPNPNNLNSPYFQSFNVSNRYINLAVSVGSAGEGKAAFTAAYGAGSLTDATTRAYTAIFGFAPAAGKVDAILNAAAPDGRGGTYTRADYFADLGQSARDGLGAKAAMVGFLLGEAVKADLGPYAQALDAFLADLGPDGIAKGHVNLLDTYGPAPTAVAGATIAFAHDQSVAPDAATTALRSTAGDDAITGSGGLDPGQSVRAGAGGDTIAVAGQVSGTIDGGDWRDVITVGELTGPVSSVATLGHPSVTTAGVVMGGPGDDLLTASAIDSGSTIDGGAGDDTLVFGSNSSAVQSLTPVGVEHIVLTEPSDMPAPINGPGQVAVLVNRLQVDLSGTTGVLDAANASQGVGGFTLTGVEAPTILIDRGGAAPLSAAFRSGTVAADLHLDATTSGENDNAYLNVHDDAVSGVSGTLRVHVDSDSALRFLDTSTTTVTIDGLGKLSARLTQNGQGLPPPTLTVDASASAGVDLGYSAVSPNARFVLSASSDTLTLALPQPGILMATLGAGADTLTVSSLANLDIANNTSVSGYATVTDFQKGVDHLVLPPDAAALPKVSAGAATTLEAALIAVSPQVAAAAYALFEFGGDSWIYHQDSTVGANTGDGLIRLVGVTGLSVVTGSAGGDVHFG